METTGHLGAQKTAAAAPPARTAGDALDHVALADRLKSEAAVQRDAQGPSPTSATVHEAAVAGTAGAGSPLPHGSAIQESFGHHDVSGIQSYVGGAAAEASGAMGATAYATGDKVAFGRSPDLHTAAHEAAHVVQQQRGVHLKDGVGQEGDPYEQHADRVADAVVGGRSAEGLLDEVHPGGGAVTAVQGVGLVVQRRVGFEFEEKSADVVNMPTAEYAAIVDKHEKMEIGDYNFKKKKEGKVPKRKTPVIKGDSGWTLETDCTMGGANLEFVVHGMNARKNGFAFDDRGGLETAVSEVGGVANALWNKKGKVVSAGDVAVAGVAEQGLTIDLVSNGYGGNFVTQATAGIRLDQIPNVLNAGAGTAQQGHRLEHGKKTMTSEDVVLGASPGRAQEALDRAVQLPQGVAQDRDLLGLLSLIGVTIHAAQVYNGGLIKNWSSLLARTHFAGMYGLLAQNPTKTYFAQNRNAWVALCVDAAGKAAGVKDLDFAPKATQLITFSVEGWLLAILDGEDLLAKIGIDSIGELGDRADPVESDLTQQKQAPVFEFRRMTQVGAAQIKPFSLDFFDYQQKVDAGDDNAALEKTNAAQQFAPPPPPAPAPAVAPAQAIAPAQQAAPPEEGKCCFLTTACCEARGLPDDCEELTLLRAHRDRVMRATPEGRALVDEYYRVAPAMVARIHARPDRDGVLDGIYAEIQRACTAIRAGEAERATEVYVGLVRGLQQTL